MDTKPTIKNFIIVILPALITIFVIFFLVMPKVKENRNNNKDVDVNKSQVTNFEECVEAGNPVMESYPRQCRHGEETFTENIEPLMNEDEAVAIARDSKECSMAGILTNNISYNSFSKTWWIDLERMPELETDGCNPACVVFEQTKTTEVNWRCTGIIPE